MEQNRETLVVNEIRLFRVVQPIDVRGRLDLRRSVSDFRLWKRPGGANDDPMREPSILTQMPDDGHAEQQVHGTFFDPPAVY
jgi:hypothetical protein